MNIIFRINYHTNWGEQIVVSVPATKSDSEAKDMAVALNYKKDGDWKGELTLENGKVPFKYKYQKVNANGEVLDEDWGEWRVIDLSKKKDKTVFVFDSWRTKSHPENSLYTSAFQEVVFKPTTCKSSPISKAKEGITWQLQMHAPRVGAGQQHCVCGSTPELGGWDLTKPILMGNDDFPKWRVDLKILAHQEVEYKYGIYDKSTKKVLFLESGANRRFFPESLDGTFCIKTDEYFSHPTGYWKGTGVSIPVFSLRTKKGLGTGEFLDLKALVDWAKKVGMNMVQILPINDTTATYSWVDSYPYASISVFALHPLYLNLEAIAGFDKAVDKKEYDKEKKRLDKLSEVDYEEVIRLKLKFARAIFKNEKDDFLASAAFKSFFKENEKWLKPYALFCQMRDQYKTPDFNQWKKNQTFSESILKKETDPKAKHFSEIAFYYFLQFHLDLQLHDAATYAREQGIVLKGDIPIGIYRFSVDAWTEPHLYNMDGQSGAPPDPFSDIGQNWGFPTYNWQEMAKDGFQWWQNRFKNLSRYFDAFRIDHILGFFRIWQIPLEQVEGTFGFFNPALPIHRHEFAERGIGFDLVRFCKPFISLEILNSTFGEEAIWVAEYFLVRENEDRFHFKGDFDTQRKVLSFFGLAENAEKAHLKDPLFKLLSNVLFFEVPGSGGMEFHPRIDFQNTLSYKYLDGGTRQKLEAFYLDYFYKRQDDFWEEQAMTKLPAIKAATNMLICGEDLGMVPDCVPGVMKDLDILSLEIQRMSKNPKTEFLEPHDIPYLSVSTPGTHDMSPLRLWWEEMTHEQRCRFYWHHLGMMGQPPVYCEPFIVKKIFQQHLLWPNMWTVFSIQDIFALSAELRRENPMDERINVPANPQHYWRYRMHVHLEDLQKDVKFSNKLSDMFRESGRG